MHTTHTRIFTLPSVHSADHTNIIMTHAERLEKKKNVHFKITKPNKQRTKTTAAKWEV